MSNSRKYNYIFYGATNDFTKTEFSEYYKMEGVQVKEDPFESDSRALQLIYKAHTYPYLNKYIELPFKGIWNKKCRVKDFHNNKPLCFVFFPKYALNKQYHKYLRQTYPGCKLVLQFWDLVKKNKMWFPKLDIDYIKEEFDLVLSFNKYDCEKYGFTYFNGETASKQDITPSKNGYESDVVFIGRTKGRYEKLMKIYDMVTDAGFTCYFYVVTDNGEKYSHGDIIFTKKLMSYREVLQHVVDSRCILELVQEGQYGFSSRAKEAFIYNKKLITDSLIVKDQRFYPSKDICFIEKPEDINLDILRDTTEVDYGYDDDYSAGKVIELMETLL